MEFLKAFFGDKAITYDELVQAINAYNGDEKNKEKLIKMVNLTDGGYVSKDKYTNLETDLSGMGYPVALLGFLKPYIKARF